MGRKVRRREEQCIPQEEHTMAKKKAKKATKKAAKKATKKKATKKK